MQTAINRRNFRDKELSVEFAECLAEYHEHLIQAGRYGSVFIKCRGSARHFLVWLRLDGCKLQEVDDVVLRRFRDHDCVCPPHQDGGGLYRRNAPPSPSTIQKVQWFVKFLEDSGRTAHPNEASQGQYHLEKFMQWAASQGHTSNMLKQYRSCSRHLLVWLHQSRIPMRSLSADVLNRYFRHDCLCSGDFMGFRQSRASRDTVCATRKFVRFLASCAMVPDEHIARKKPLNSELHAFHVWLRQHRGICESTIQDYDREVSALVDGLGKDTTSYDAALVRKVLLDRFIHVSKTHAQRLTSVMRVYLKFLSSTGECPASLIGAIPRTGLWSLETLPRYLPMEDIERVIAACDGSRPTDIRNRAILLLLARLALRAADIRFLQLNDIDWGNAELHVHGKSKRSARLPLPQDVGDALLAYIENTRPKVAEKTVFLRSCAPHRPFAYSTAISGIVHNALEHAGVHSPNGQGAHIFRHSAATALLRSGASLDTVGALLRHERTFTTELYAKVDLPMLQLVTQPWMGDTQ